MRPLTHFCVLVSCFALVNAEPIDSRQKVLALVFLSSECPISNKMAPEIERLYRSFPTNALAFFLVYPNESDTEKVISVHRKEYQMTAPYLRDPSHEWVKKGRVTVTPEAAVFDAERKLIYQGRINDQFLALGRARPEAIHHDLREAIENALAGRPLTTNHTQAVGCYIESRK